MENKFYFDEIRASVIKESQIAIQGLCVADFIDNSKKASAVLIDGEKQLELEVSWYLASIHAVKKSYSGSRQMTKVVTFTIDLPEEFSNSATMRLYLTENNNKRELYSCSGSKLKKYLGELCACVDSVTTDDKNIIVKGWAIDSSDIELSVTNEANGREVSCEVDWFMRTDVLQAFMECKESRTVGFIVKLPNSNDRYKLYMRAGSRETVYRVSSAKGASRFTLVNTIYNYTSKTVYSLKNYGLKATIEKGKRRIKLSMQHDVKSYEKWLKKKAPSAKELSEQRKTIFDYQPTFSILVPLYETPERFLVELIDSVKHQTYGNWELCFSDGSRDKEPLQRLISEYSSKDNRIKYIAEKKGPLGISENTNQAYEIATGDYIVLGDHDDLLRADALFECAKALNVSKSDVIYTDEDKTDAKSKHFFEPNFKPDFNIDLLRSNNYICHMFVVSKALVEKVGLFDSAFDGAQDYDFILRCVEQANEVKHIPKAVYHWRTHQASTAATPEAKLYAFEAGKRAIAAHYKRLGLDAEVGNADNLGFYKTKYKIKGNPLISIVIPNKDHIEDLRKCMDSIDQRSTYRNYEFIIVENNSEKNDTFEWYHELEKRDNVHVMYWDKEFNYSAINNYGVNYAHGEYILLLNNDTEIINPDCLEQMLGYCQREDVGIVGARLYYDDGSIQHAGVIVGYGGIAGHAFVALNEEDGLYQSRTKVACDYSAVTAACLMTKKSVFEEVGGLEEQFKVAFNDIDFCMKVRATGRLVVYNANAKLYHFESKSRGLEDTPEKQERFAREIRLFRERWPEILDKGDPYYNVNLTLNKSDFSLRP